MIRTSNPEYCVGLNRGKCDELLALHGVPAEKIRDLRIGVSSDYNLKVGEYNPRNNDLTLHPERLWSSYKSFQKMIQEAESSDSLGVTSRLSLFLDPDYRWWLNPGLGVVVEGNKSKLLEQVELALSKSINNTLLHELKHAIDFNTSPKKRIAQLLALRGVGFLSWLVANNQAYHQFLAPNLDEPVRTGASLGLSLVSGAVIWATGYYILNPVENAARSFAQERSKDPYWQDLANIIPLSSEYRLD